MSVPAKKRTKSAKRKRAAQSALQAASLHYCSHCQQAVLPHCVCQNCGYYKDRAVIKIKSRNKKKSS